MHHKIWATPTCWYIQNSFCKVGRLKLHPFFGWVTEPRSDCAGSPSSELTGKQESSRSLVPHDSAVSRLCLGANGITCSVMLICWDKSDSPRWRLHQRELLTQYLGVAARAVYVHTLKNNRWLVEQNTWATFSLSRQYKRAKVAKAHFHSDCAVK